MMMVFWALAGWAQAKEAFYAPDIRIFSSVPSDTHFEFSGVELGGAVKGLKYKNDSATFSEGIGVVPTSAGEWTFQRQKGSWVENGKKVYYELLPSPFPFIAAETCDAWGLRIRPYRTRHNMAWLQLECEPSGDQKVLVRISVPEDGKIEILPGFSEAIPKSVSSFEARIDPETFHDGWFRIRFADDEKEKYVYRIEKFSFERMDQERAPFRSHLSLQAGYFTGDSRRGAGASEYKTPAWRFTGQSQYDLNQEGLSAEAFGEGSFSILSEKAPESAPFYLGAGIGLRTLGFDLTLGLEQGWFSDIFKGLGPTAILRFRPFFFGVMPPEIFVKATGFGLFSSEYTTSTALLGVGATFWWERAKLPLGILVRLDQLSWTWKNSSQDKGSLLCVSLGIRKEL